MVIQACVKHIFINHQPVYADHLFWSRVYSSFWAIQTCLWMLKNVFSHTYMNISGRGVNADLKIFPWASTSSPVKLKHSCGKRQTALTARANVESSRKSKYLNSGFPFGACNLNNTKDKINLLLCFLLYALLYCRIWILFVDQRLSFDVWERLITENVCENSEFVEFIVLCSISKFCEQGA